ncbi:hypothetical protein GPECTOR_19g314 [Gonium pectorale]|uniref:Polymerase nucleotidyl transferase domain-containing protein n=1 Tax=Gonium pectorale TaxID=33097 RepID=A0A150GJ74_GONPE|nr:hypothetical protein GPECTOR_19g314 [Gonium pectorale]|eukprot:KXZ49863.1 hypothetical protein GPECTOR_19g314 [Gonium pectorale]
MDDALAAADARGAGSGCTCPCYCGRRIPARCSHTWKSCLPRAWLAENVERVINKALAQWRTSIGGDWAAQVLVDGSIFKGTALEGSDVDLVVRTAFPVPRRLKHKLHRIIRASLSAHFRAADQVWGVKLLPRRKSAELELEVALELEEEEEAEEEAEEEREEGDGTGREAPVRRPAAAAGGGDEDARFEVLCEPPASAAGCGSPHPKLVRLSADLLFERGTVGEPLSRIVNPFAGLDSARLAVMALKLFQKQAGSLSGPSNFVKEAMVVHVVTDCELRLPSWDTSGERPPPPTESAMQAFYMALSLFLAADSAEHLDARVRPHCVVAAGCLFDRGPFAIWHNRVFRALGELRVLMEELAASGPAADQETAVQGLRRIFEGRKPPAGGDTVDPGCLPETAGHEQQQADQVQAPAAISAT